MAKRLTPAPGQRLAALFLLAALCACTTTSPAPPAEVRPAGWRIVERTGEARYSPPDTTVWMAATTGRALAAGSEVATGRGGRLIVDAPGRHISVGPDSRFVLPDQDRDEWLDHRAGWLRYRIAEAGAQRFRIHTQSLELELSAGVVDVHVNDQATEVTVKEGQVRVATPDGMRESQMIAGQSARAGGAGSSELAVRLAPGDALQPIEPVIVPAVYPTRPPAAKAPEDSPAASEPAHPTLEPMVTPPLPDQGAVPVALGEASTPQTARGQSPSSDPLPPAETPPAADDRVVETSAPDSGQTDAATLRRSKFERLSAGMIEGIQPAHPAQFDHRLIR